MASNRNGVPAILLNHFKRHQVLPERLLSRPTHAAPHRQGPDVALAKDAVRLFSNNAPVAMAYFGLPPNRTVMLGMRLDLGSPAQDQGGSFASTIAGPLG
jgi:hypothetical protein